MNSPVRLHPFWGINFRWPSQRWLYVMKPNPQQPVAKRACIQIKRECETAGCSWRHSASSGSPLIHGWFLSSLHRRPQKKIWTVSRRLIASNMEDHFQDRKVDNSMSWTLRLSISWLHWSVAHQKAEKSIDWIWCLKGLAVLFQTSLRS